MFPDALAPSVKDLTRDDVFPFFLGEPFRMMIFAISLDSRIRCSNIICVRLSVEGTQIRICENMVHAGGAELSSRALTCVLLGKPRAGTVLYDVSAITPART